MRSFLLVSLLSLTSFLSFGQWLNYDSAIVHSKGKTKKVKTVSRVSGTSTIKRIKKGQWLHYNESGILILRESYKIQGGVSVANGRFEYFDLDGNLIKSDFYSLGRLSNSTYVSQGLLQFGNKRYIILKDSIGYFSESVYSKDGTFIRGVDLAPGKVPDLHAGQAKHLQLEQTIGDPTILTFKPMTKNNLVPNPGFEDTRLNKSTMSVASGQVDEWEVASPSPDYFISRKLAYEGKGAMGFRVYSFTNHIEYLRVRLTKPLQKGETYCVTLRVRLSEESSLITNLLGVYFHEDRWNIDPYNPVMPKPQIVLKNRWLVYKSGWMTLQCSFVAQGGEEFMHIGSFEPMEGLNVYPTTGNKYQCYYLLDNVSVSESETCECNMQTDTPLPADEFNPQDSVRTKPAPGKTWVLEDVYFEIDRSELLDRSFVTLNALVEFLTANPSVHIEIGGHTSNTGSEEHNIALSADRARSVMQYVIRKGIQPQRITAKGYGFNQPIADNNSEEGRTLNRRVQITIIE